MRIEDFINDEYREYAKYVLESRAIPSVIDGFKPSQRKIVYTALQNSRTKFVKTAALSGNVISQAEYHHGDASLNAAIPLLTSEWGNNVPVLEGEGNFGSRLVPESAAARYTFSRLHPNFLKYFKDNDILPAHSDSENPEPAHYLPLIPWVLVNGVKGIAVGFATEIQPHSPVSLIKACTEYLTKGRISRKIKPSFPDFTGKVYWSNDREKYIARGAYSLTGRTMTVTDLPPGMDRESYIKYLDKLEDRAEPPLVYYNDESSEAFRFVIRLKNKTPLDEEFLLKTFKLERVLNQNLTVIDENGNLKVFEDSREIVAHFVEHRLNVYTERYRHYTQRDLQEKARLESLLAFIQAVLNGKIILKNKTRSQLEAETGKIVGQEFVAGCIALRTYRFCRDEILDLKTKINNLKIDLASWKSVDIRAQFQQELKELG